MTALQMEMISKRLKSIRNLKGMKQKEMGEFLGMGEYYGNIERGQENPSDTTYLKIAKKLDVDYDWLVNGEGDFPIPERIPTPEVKEVVPMVEEKKLAVPELIPQAVSVTEVPYFDREDKPAVPIKLIDKSIIFKVKHVYGITIEITVESMSATCSLNFHNGTGNMDIERIQAYIDLLTWAKGQLQEVI